jgi:hypothetical protein
MGGDGGVVPRRSDLVKVKGYKFARASHQGGLGSKPNLLKRSVLSQDISDHSSRYEICALSQLPLEHPVVCSIQGQFFIKEKILEALLNKTLPTSFGIKSIKQLLPVSRDFHGVCQISGSSLGESALLVQPCGCVLSSKSAMAENSDCPVCGCTATAVLTLVSSNSVSATAAVDNATVSTQAPAGKKAKIDLSIADLFH